MFYLDLNVYPSTIEEKVYEDLCTVIFYGYFECAISTRIKTVSDSQWALFLNQNLILIIWLR